MIIDFWSFNFISFKKKRGVKSSKTKLSNNIFKRIRKQNVLPSNYFSFTFVCYELYANNFHFLPQLNNWILSIFRSDDVNKFLCIYIYIYIFEFDKINGKKTRGACNSKAHRNKIIFADSIAFLFSSESVTFFIEKLLNECEQFSFLVFHFPTVIDSCSFSISFNLDSVEYYFCIASL